MGPGNFAMPSDFSDTTTPVLGRDHRQADSLVNKRLMLSLVLIVICGVWIYARFGATASAPSSFHTADIGNFTTPKYFIVTPAFDFSNINVRAGPGMQYRILETIPRGTQLTGVGRTVDSDGDFWIVLVNGRGYALESVLSPANKSTP